MKYALVVDVGTTNVKVGLVDPTGNVVFKNTTVNEAFKTENGAYEHDPKVLLQTIESLSLSIPDDLKKDIAFLGLSAYQFGWLPLDEQGQPIGRIMTLLDNRSKSVMDALQAEFPVEEIYEKTGCPPLFTYSFSKLLWLKKDKPELYSKAKAYADIKGFLLKSWTNNFVTEPSTAAATQLLNVHSLDWDEDILNWAGIDRSYLPQLVAGDEFCGTLTENAAKTLGLPAGLPVLPGLYDGGAMILGMGGFGDDMAVCNLGTTAMLRGCASKPLLDDAAKMRLQTYPLLKNYWVTGGALNNSGVALGWFKNTFSPGTSFEDLLEGISEIATCSEGLYCLPFLTGERDPRMGNEACGTFFGIREYHSKEHFTRAILEGIGYSLALIQEAIAENGFRPKLVRIGGSGAKSDIWLTILSSILNVKIERMNTPEAALIGVSLLGFKALSVFDSMDEGMHQMIHAEQIFEPNKSMTTSYAQGYSHFKKVNKTIKQLYKEHDVFVSSN